VILFAVAALIHVVVVPVALTLIPLGSFDKAVGTLIQWALLIILDVLLMAVFYRFGPSNDVRCSWLSTGGVMAALLWLMASALFSLYVAASARYNQVYGSIGGVVVLLTWLYLSFYVILLGAELNSAIAAERKDAANTAQEIPGRRSARED
jgi:membrane protein